MGACLVSENTVETRALLRLERTMNLLEGGKGGEGRVGERGRVWERGRVGERGRLGSEVGEGRGEEGRGGGRDDCYTYYNRYVQ